MDQGLGDRLFDFALDSIKFLSTFPKLPEAHIVRYQLAKCSTSSGANYEEAQAASSKADFSHKMKISLREMKESNYWLRISLKSNFGQNNINKNLIEESFELKNILGQFAVSFKHFLIFNF